MKTRWGHLEGRAASRRCPCLQASPVHPQSGKTQPKEYKVCPMRENRSKRIPVRTAACLLVLAVAGLSTLAKDSKYLPKSHLLHHFSKVTKMEVVELSVHFAPAQAIHPV